MLPEVVSVVFAVVIFYSTVRFLIADDGRPVHGIYPRKGKYFAVKFCLYLSVRFAVRCFRTVFGSRARSGNDRDEADWPVKLPEDIKAFDGLFFAGGNRQGYYFVMGVERCHKNVFNGYFYLLVPNNGLLCSFKLPDVIVFDGKEDEFAAGGFFIAPGQSMKKWRLRFSGPMWLKSDPDEAFQVRFTAEWSTKFDSFNCDEDADQFSIARSVARQPWTTEFFRSVRWSPGFRYYQTGASRVETVVGRDVHRFYAQSVRRHVHGTKADLLSQHRSALFHIFLDNGTTAVVAIVSKREHISLTEIGYVQKSDGSMRAVEWCDFQLYQHGEWGRPPMDHGFQFKAGGKIYTVQLKVLQEHSHFDGWNWESRVIERFVKCTVNGVRGRGISEFQYRNTTGRPSELNDSDPPWFQVYRPHYIYS